MFHLTFQKIIILYQVLELPPFLVFLKVEQNQGCWGKTQQPNPPKASSKVEDEQQGMQNTELLGCVFHPTSDVGLQNPTKINTSDFDLDIHPRKKRNKELAHSPS